MGGCCSRPTETSADKGSRGAHRVDRNGLPLSVDQDGAAMVDDGAAAMGAASAPGRSAVVTIPVFEPGDGDAMSAVGPADGRNAAVGAAFGSSSPLSTQGTVGNTGDPSSLDCRSHCSLPTAPSRLDEELARGEAARKDIEHAVAVATAAVHLRSMERARKTTSRRQSVSGMLPEVDSVATGAAAVELSPQQAKEVLQVLHLHVEEYCVRRNKMDTSLGHLESEVQNVKLFERFETV